MKKKLGFLGTIMDNPKITFLLVAIMVVFGIYGLDQMNKQELPEFVVREGLVVGVYPGATAEEVEEQLTKPLEEYLFTFQQISKENTSSYTKEGITYVFVSLDNSVMNQTETWSKIRHGLKDFKAQLPMGVMALAVMDDFGNSSSLLITMDSEDKTYRELEEYMDVLKTRLRAVPAVGNINSFGEQKEEINIYIDKETLVAYGITHEMLMMNLFAQGLLTIGGSIESEYNNTALHVVSPYKSERELAEQVVMTTPSGETVQLKDIARIEREYAEPTSFITKDGKRALVLNVEMRPDNNIVKFGENVDQVLHDFQRTIPDGVSLYRITDLPKVVDDSIKGFMKDLLTAIIVVILVMLMLFPFSSAIIPAIEIPLTTAITFCIMYIIGYEMNTVTLAALIVTLGMIVDDSIVMIDGHMDNLRHGLSPWDAALKSAKTFFPSLIVATITICSIFFPFLYTMEGPLADFVQFFPTTITISLGTSLALAMLLTPWLEYKMIKLKKENQRTNFIERTQNKFFVFLENTYEKVLTHCFKHPYVTLMIGGGSVALAAFILLNLPLQLMPKAERDSFAVEIYLPEGSTLNQTEKVCKQFEAMLEKDKDVESITTFVGTSSPRFMASYTPNMPAPSYAQMIVRTPSPRHTEKVIKRYHDDYIDTIPNATIRIKQLDFQAVKNPIEVRLQGEDKQLLRQYGDTLKAFFNKYPDDLQWIHSDFDGSVPSVKIELKPEEASRLGVTKAVLSANLASLYGGMPMTTVWEGDYSLAVKLRMDRKDSVVTNEDLLNTLIPTNVPGVWVPLRQVASIEPDWQPAQIVHRNGVPCLTVGVDTKFEQSQAVIMKELRTYLDGDFKAMLPEGITMSYGGLDAVNEFNMNGIAIGLVASVIIVFFFLLFNFKTIRLTVLSLCGTLLCVLGAVLGIAVFGVDLSMTAIVGVVSLIGINVRNTIVMFDYAEELRREGLPLKEVAFEAGRRRMRPIFLTSATTAVGVIPMIIHRSTLWMPMGIVICFGTICAIGFIVTVMPVAYWK